MLSYCLLPLQYLRCYHFKVVPLHGLYTTSTSAYTLLPTTCFPYYLRHQEGTRDPYPYPYPTLSRRARGILCSSCSRPAPRPRVWRAHLSPGRWLLPLFMATTYTSLPNVSNKALRSNVTVLLITTYQHIFVYYSTGGTGIEDSCRAGLPRCHSAQPTPNPNPNPNPNPYPNPSPEPRTPTPNP